MLPKNKTLQAIEKEFKTRTGARIRAVGIGNTLLISGDLDNVALAAALLYTLMPSNYVHLGADSYEQAGQASLYLNLPHALECLGVAS